MARFAVRAADLTIVTNGALAEHVDTFGGKPVVLPDPLPIPPFEVDSGLARDTNIVSVIATYAADEPIADILAAAALLGTEFSFRLTGRADG